jgi:hypothetical protein
MYATHSLFVSKHYHNFRENCRTSPVGTFSQGETVRLFRTVHHGNSRNRSDQFQISENFFSKPLHRLVPRNSGRFYAVTVTHTSTFSPKLFRTIHRNVPRKSQGFGFSLKRNVMCHFNSVHYVNFEEIWSDFPKFGNSEKRKSEKKKPLGNFRILNSNSKGCAFSVFFTEHALAGTHIKLVNRYKSENFEKVVPKIGKPKFRKTVFFFAVFLVFYTS